MKELEKDSEMNERYFVIEVFDSYRRDGVEKPTGSLLNYLVRTIIERPKVIVLRFGSNHENGDEGLVEFCESVKKLDLTKDIIVICVLPVMNVYLLKRLSDAGVDFIIPDSYVESSAGEMEKRIDQIGNSSFLGVSRVDELYQLLSKFKTDKVMASVCPFINSRNSDFGETLTVCGAHFNRLVLGGRRLREICESAAHFECEFFRSPKETDRIANGRQ